MASLLRRSLNTLLRSRRRLSLCTRRQGADGLAARGPNPKARADPRGRVSFTRNSQHRQGPQVRPLRRFFPPSSPFLFLQHDSFRTGTLHPGGHTHRVSPSSDPSFCPCSGCLTCDCQFFQQLADRILANRPRISFLFQGAPLALGSHRVTVRFSTSRRLVPY